mmetsp:Transcript_94106/g.255542  ORF Transcript_94106/g.255542 Transcript_94106/m.255542 type:complete len:229 (+) Transcript_94106:191-877(+)
MEAAHERSTEAWSVRPGRRTSAPTPGPRAGPARTRRRFGAPPLWRLQDYRPTSGTHNLRELRRSAPHNCRVVQLLARRCEPSQGGGGGRKGGRGKAESTDGAAVGSARARPGGVSRCRRGAATSRAGPGGSPPRRPGPRRPRPPGSEASCWAAGAAGRRAAAASSLPRCCPRTPRRCRSRRRCPRPSPGAGPRGRRGTRSTGCLDPSRSSRAGSSPRASPRPAAKASA